MPTPETLATKTSDPAIFLSVPCNPLYWIGTRVSSIASGYQMYRPLLFEVSYVPQVPVTYSGNVIYGTLFGEGRDMSALQQSLASSNGGGITPCYTPAKSKVKLGEANLPFKLFRVKGFASEPVNNPFRWVATYSGSNPSGTSTSAPGWVVVRWKFEFVNGVGNGGDSVSTTYTTPPETQQALAEHLARNALRQERALSPLFGTVIGLLKLSGVQLLRNIAVLFLENTKAMASGDQTLFGAGSMAAVIPPSKREQNETPVTVIKDSAGVEWEVPDDTPVVIYQQGPVIISGQSPDPPSPTPVDKHFDVYAIVVSFNGYLFQGNTVTVDARNSTEAQGIFTGTATYEGTKKVDVTATIGAAIVLSIEVSNTPTSVVGTKAQILVKLVGSSASDYYEYNLSFTPSLYVGAQSGPAVYDFSLPNPEAYFQAAKLSVMPTTEDL